MSSYITEKALRPYDIFISVKVKDKYGIANINTLSKRAFIGISICSHLFSKDNLSKICFWASNCFEEFLILIADEPQAYSFMSFKGENYSEALKKAKRIGEEKKTSILRVIDSLDIDNIRIIRWGTLEKSKLYNMVEKLIFNCYYKEKRFKQDVLYHVKQRKILWSNGISNSEEFDYETASKYVLKEISAMVYLLEYSKPCFSIQIFPLEIPKPLLGLYKKKYCSKISLSPTKSGYMHIII